MRWARKVRLLARSLFRKNEVDAELSEEMRFHLERQVEDGVGSGMSREEARRAAIREFGGVELVKEECRDTRRTAFLDHVYRDARYALRGLEKSPTFTIFAVTVLALGIAANTSIFSIADNVLLRPLPYRNADRLVMVWEDGSSFGFPKNTPAPGNFADWKSRNQVFEDIAAVGFEGSLTLLGEGSPEELQTRGATSNLFSLLGVQPALGRLFRPDDDDPGGGRVAILSYGLWQRRFGGDPQVIGKDLTLSQAKYTVIGVLPRGVHFLSRETELWTNAQFTPQQLANHGSHFLQVVARLKPGVSLQSANANLATIAAQLEKEHPDTNSKTGAFAVPLRDQLSGDIRPAILMLIGAVCFVLLIACANVANLLLARATRRRRELALPLALGATRRRLIQQMLTESVLLALLSGAAGLLLSVWGTKFLAALIPAGIAPLDGSGIDRRVLTFTTLISLGTGVLFGIMPALRTSLLDVASLKQGNAQSGGVGTGGKRIRDALVVCEVTLAVVLLTGAALMIRSLGNLYHLDPGFRAEHVLVVQTPLPRPKYADFARRAAFYDQVLARVGSLPGVVSAGYTTWVPLTNYGGANGITIEGHPEPAPGQMPIPNTRIVSKDYVRTLGMKLIEGRLIDERDSKGTQPVALINQAMARKWWPAEEAVGRRFKEGDYAAAAPWITIVGIVDDVHQAGLEAAARPEMYMPYQQQDFFQPSFLAVRTSGDPMSVVEEVRQQVWAVDKEQAVTGAMPLEDLIDDNLAARRMQTSLLGGLAGMALLLVSIGIYAVLSFTVTQRTQEIGVRLALGASRRDVLKMILLQGLRLFLAGAALGVVAALALSRALVHLLYGVSAYDPASFACVTLLLTAIAALACYIPAQRAMRVDPMVVLRYE